jgi:hypothetical protein
MPASTWVAFLLDGKAPDAWPLNIRVWTYIPTIRPCIVHGQDSVASEGEETTHVYYNGVDSNTICANDNPPKCYSLPRIGISACTFVPQPLVKILCTRRHS